AKKEVMFAQGQLIADVLAQTAVETERADSQLNPQASRSVLRALLKGSTVRGRLFDSDGGLITDSRILNDQVVAVALPPIDSQSGGRSWGALFEPERWEALPWLAWRREARQRAVGEEVEEALSGEIAESVRFNDKGELIVSVSIPVQRVQSVLGVVTLEIGEIEEIVTEARFAILPFFAVALFVSIGSSVGLTLLIASPIRRLARAADAVRDGVGRQDRHAIPDISNRKDEIGELSRSLQAMTESLYDRMEATEHFAADVAHELKNPLTSIRSAVETLALAKDDATRAKLSAVIEHDVRRMDRLITDISNASRLDAELARELFEPVDLGRLLADIVEAYGATQREDAPQVAFEQAGEGPCLVLGSAPSLAQVFRNLIDNASSFSPPGADVRVRLQRAPDRALVTVEDQGPGVPPENLASIFQRFYSDRPAGADFGANSGLGLSISKQIVEAHRGRIWAENRLQDPDDPDSPRLGAVFHVETPLMSRGG
ncbi:MAG: stimulus-sensing domain-containing protein, partial [Pseudomonadota bacterium]